MSTTRATKQFAPFVIQGDEWIRWVAVCRNVVDEPDDPFCENEVHYIDVVCEYATRTVPDAFGLVHVSWQKDDDLSPLVEMYFAGLAQQKLREGTAYIEVDM